MRLIYDVYETEADLPSTVTDGRVTDRVRIKTSRIATWNQIYDSGMIPKHWAVHRKFTSFGLDNWNPKQIKPLVWEAEATYLHVLELDPLKKPPKITFDGTLIEMPTFKDNKGRLTTNTAGELFTGIMEQVPIMDYTVTWYQAFDSPWFQTLLGKVNSDTIRLRGLSWERRTVLCGGITGGEVTNINGRTVSQYSMRLMANPQGWSQVILNRGTVELQDEFTYTRTDENGNPVNPVRTGRKIQVKISDGEPKPLDINGRQIFGYLGTEIPLTKLHTITFHIQGEAPFNRLPIN